MKMPLGLDIRADTDVNSDSRNYGLVNSVLTQSFNDGPTLASTVFVLIFVALVVGAVLTYVILRELNNHGRILSAHNQGLVVLDTQLGAVRPHRSQIE